METFEEQIANRCKHFTGIQNKKCSLDIIYDDVKQPDVRPYKFPCFKSGMLAGGHCEQAQFSSEEETKKEANELREQCRLSLIGYTDVVKEIEKTGKLQGIMKCPNCAKETLSYNKEPNSGHISARCTACGLNWME